MKRIARSALISVWAWAALGIAPATAASSDAADYPTRPIRLVVPVSAGGGTDIVARFIGQQLTESWGQQVVVDNRTGAGGSIGAAIVADSAPDGHTILLGSVGHITFTPALFRKLPYDPQGFAPISVVAQQPFVLATHPSFPAKSIGELIALAKSRPGKVNYGSGGNGGASHLGIELLQLTTGISMVHVPYKGTGPGMTALLSGEIPMLLVGVATVLPHIKRGSIRPLAVSGSSRSKALPDVPTIAEAGVPGYAFDVWYGMLFPRGTARAVVSKANATLVTILKSPETAKRFATLGLEPLHSTPQQFAVLIAREIPKWRKVVKAAGITLN
jgi:tripartite-type tricarboxylate transporter receptor subunit TctC